VRKAALGASRVWGAASGAGWAAGDARHEVGGGRCLATRRLGPRSRQTCPAGGRAARALRPVPPSHPPRRARPPRSFDARLEEAAFAVELLESEGGGPAAASEGAPLLREALAGLAALGAALERWELSRLLSGPHDARGAVVTVQAGAGGVDAMDWAEMLERMCAGRRGLGGGVSWGLVRAQSLAACGLLAQRPGN
jgi:hypothetical protein